MQIRPAKPTEAEQISRLAIESKAHWGYGAEAMATFRVELTFDGETLARRLAHVAEDSRELLGFYTLADATESTLDLDRDCVELEHLYIRRDRLKQGLGAALLNHASVAARKLGAQRLLIQSDPNAEGFYAKLGARVLARIPTSIPGRTLPLMELWLPRS